VAPDGTVTLGERFLTFADPGRPLTPPILRLTGIRDEDLRGAPSSMEAVALFVTFAFRDGPPCFVGHNVSFDVAFLERAGMPTGSESLDTAELASILLPTASSYALQRLAADAAIVPDAAHRARSCFGSSYIASEGTCARAVCLRRTFIWWHLCPLVRQHLPR